MSPQVPADDGARRAVRPGRAADVGHRDADEPDGTDAPVVLPTREDPLAAAASAVVGGPAGRRARPGRDPLRAVLVAGTALGLAVLAAAVVLRDYCRGTVWSTPERFLHACYSDVPTIWSSGYLDRVLPYLERFGAPGTGGSYLDVPFGQGWLLWGLGRLAGRGATATDVFDLTVLLGAVALVLLVASTARVAGRRPWDALLVAGSPVVLCCALVGTTLLPAALVVGALWATSRGRAVTSGVLLGLATLLWQPASVVVVALLLVRLRRRRDATPADDGAASAVAGPGDDIDEEQRPAAPVVVDAGVRTALAALVVWVVGGLPVLVDNSSVWLGAVTARVVNGPGYGSVWLLGRLLDVPTSVAATTATSLLLAVAGVAAVALLVLRAPRAPRLPVVALLLVLVVLLTAPALPPQAAVVVLPLAALSLPRWRLLLAWGAVEAAAATGTWLYLYGLEVPERGLPEWGYAVVLVARLVALVVLGLRAVDITLHPGRDVVRRPAVEGGPGADDPALPDDEVDDAVGRAGRHGATAPPDDAATARTGA